MGSMIDGVNALIANEHRGGNATPLVLLTMMIDDSTSMRFFNNFIAVMAGHNGLLDTLQQDPHAKLIVAKTEYMHGKTLSNDYRPLSRAVRMTSDNYLLFGGTPLFYTTQKVLGNVIQQTKRYEDEGNDVRTLTLLLTDGENRGRGMITARQVSRIIGPMFDSGKHIVAGVGVNSGRTDFREVFLAMGIPEQWILTIASHEGIRAAFQGFSASASQSVSETGFAETRLAGFSQTDTKRD